MKKFLFYFSIFASFVIIDIIIACVIALIFNPTATSLSYNLGFSMGQIFVLLFAAGAALLCRSKFYKMIFHQEKNFSNWVGGILVAIAVIWFACDLVVGLSAQDALTR